MSILPRPIAAPTPRTKDSNRIAVFYAILLLILVVPQLFTFDKFLPYLDSLNLPGGTRLAYFLGALLVSTEVFALPFLLRMPVSRAFRWFSMLCTWIVAAIWVKLSFFIVFSDNPIDNAGYLGTLVKLTPGWWAVFLSLAIAILTIWASWGLWPGKRKK